MCLSKSRVSLSDRTTIRIPEPFRFGIGSESLRTNPQNFVVPTENPTNSYFTQQKPNKFVRLPTLADAANNTLPKPDLHLSICGEIITPAAQFLEELDQYENSRLRYPECDTQQLLGEPSQSREFHENGTGMSSANPGLNVPERQTNSSSAAEKRLYRQSSSQM